MITLTTNPFFFFTLFFRIPSIDSLPGTPRLIPPEEGRRVFFWLLNVQLTLTMGTSRRHWVDNIEREARNLGLEGMIRWDGKE